MPQKNKYIIYKLVKSQKELRTCRVELQDREGQLPKGVKCACLVELQERESNSIFQGY